jgi:transcriptional/translational regulatory protein YebC/TACO1
MQDALCLSCTTNNSLSGSDGALLPEDILHVCASALGTQQSTLRPPPPVTDAPLRLLIASQWSKIKQKKGAKDALKSLLYTRASRVSALYDS